MNNNLSRFRRESVSSFEKIDDLCPDARLLEYILLSAHQNRELFEQFQHHFLACETCQKRIRLIELFYVILDAEIRQPVSPVAVEMAQKLAEPQSA
jgi:hypothetical protein